MSIRNTYRRESVPFNNSQPYRYRTHNVRRFHRFASNAIEAEDTEDGEEIDATDIDSIPEYKDMDPVRIGTHFAEIETDISSEDLRSVISPEVLSLVENRQLAYLSLPDLLQLPDQSPNGGGNQKRRSQTSIEYNDVSPSHSVESVAIDLETDEDIGTMDDIPTEDVDDETESTNEEAIGDFNEFVHMRVKVEKKPYLANAMKVTVSVQPPSEVEEEESEENQLYEQYEQYEDELLSSSSCASADALTENISGSESEQGSGESESESGNDKSEEESESVDQDESLSEQSNDEDTGESGLESESEEDPIENSVAKIEMSLKDVEKENKTENILNESIELDEKPKDETEQMMDLLNAAIDNSEKSKAKIIEQAILEKVLEAEAVAVAEGEKLTAGIGDTSTASPMVNVKSLGESVVSGVANASNSVSSAKNKTISVGEQGKEELTEKLKSTVISDDNQGMTKIVATIEKEPGATAITVAGSIDNAKTEAMELDKRIHQGTLAIAGDVSKSIETSGMKVLNSPILNKPISASNIIVPPPNALVVANVIVHETPKSSQSPKLLPKSVLDKPESILPSVTAADEVSKLKVEVVTPVVASAVVENLHPSMHGSSDELRSEKLESGLKFSEKEDYLSVYAADTADSSEEEDNILGVQKTKEETEDDRKEVEQAKDKLIEDWKSTRRESIEELDDKFQHILEDMVSELHMEPIIPVLPKKLKEAVHVSDEESKKASNSAASARSSESVRELTDIDMFEGSIPASPNLSQVSEHSSAQSNTKFMQRIDASIQISNQENNISSGKLSKENSEQHNRHSAGSNASRNKSSSSLRLMSPIYASTPLTKSPYSGKLDKSNESLKPNMTTFENENIEEAISSILENKEAFKEPIMLEPLRIATPIKILSRTGSKTSLKSQKSHEMSPISKNHNKPINSSKKLYTELTVSQPNLDLDVEKTPNALSVTSPQSQLPTLSPLENHSPNHNAHLIQEAANSSSKTLNPSDITVSNNKANRSSSLSSKGSKSPTISQHSSFQTDQSADEDVLRIEDDNDLPNFNFIQSNPEIGDDSESSRDEDSPSQRRKWKNSTEIASTLSHYLHIIKTETIENCVTEIIPLLTQLLVTSRKSKAEHGLPTMIATLSAIRVLCERLLHVKVMSGETALRNMDLSWLLRILCKLSADPESKLKPEASFTLAKLVKAAGPELITRPIYFLLVMENDGYGHRKGSQGSKTKAAALDTLTYALLTFPKEEFDDLEEIARWVCLVVMHPHRRVRQAALECIAVLGNRIGSPDAAVSRFRGYLVYEAEHQYNKSDSDGSTAGQKSAIKHFDGKGVFDVSAITAISFRIRKRILPLPSPQGLVEYGVKVPTGQDLVLILTKMQEEEEEEYEGSTSDESVHSANDLNSDGGSESESIRMSDLEKTVKDDRTFGKKPKVVKDDDDDVDLITPDVAYILSGKGRVNKQELINDNAINNDEEATSQPDDKEKKKKALRKKRQKKRHVERTYSEYEDDSPAED